MSNKRETSKDDDALLEALSPIVTKLIDKNYESSQDKIALQMAPLIGSAIREQIKSQKDDVVDALYPVMGNMISRYVTKMLEETLNTINLQIQNGLSFESFTRKIRAKAKGISEAQLLLDENSSSSIQAVLLIHKETGIILTEAHNPDTPLHEPEMLASMMSAIRSFINDWIDKNEKDNEVGEIEYGGHKIVLENGGYSYLAVIVDGATYFKTYQDIRQTLEEIVLKHGEDIKKFNGDLSSFPNIDIYKKLSSLLSSNKTSQNKQQKTHPLIFLIPLILLGMISWNFYTSYIDNSLSSAINKSINSNPHLSLYKISVSSEDLNVTLKGQVPLEYHKKLIQEIVEKQKKAQTITNKILVLQTLDDPMQISSQVSYLINGLNLDESVNLKYRYYYPNLTILGSTWDDTRKKKIIKLIKKANFTPKIDFKIDIIPPVIQEIIYFDKGSAKISFQNRTKLIQLGKKLYSIDKNLSISLNGYGDKSGSPQAQKHVVDNRVKNIFDLLTDTIKVSQKIEKHSFYSMPQELNNSIVLQSARCVIITLEKGN